MEQHPMPRQITTFEFKLIGFLTLKQFIYLAIFIPSGYIVFRLIPIPLLNIVMGAMVGGVGVAFAFIPINDRPLDVWIKNFIKRMVSPTQYKYYKNNPSIYFLKDLFFISDPHHVMTHVESKEKLLAYMARIKSAEPSQTAKKQAISTLLQNPDEGFVNQKKPSAPKPIVTPSSDPVSSKKPFFSGIVKNHSFLPLPGILIYVKDDKGKVVRLLKTNPHGVFATFNPLPSSEYLFELRDPKSAHFFDTMKIRVASPNSNPLEIFSKELI